VRKGVRRTFLSYVRLIGEYPYPTLNFIVFTPSVDKIAGSLSVPGFPMPLESYNVFKQNLGKITVASKGR